LLFGNEGKGAPDEIHQWAKTNRITIPKYKDGLRSLNLAVSVGIATYEALRQINT
jgi:tRNA(Leu) C34 or U34 (ribose-2'-O)-methylase TrmL